MRDILRAKVNQHDYVRRKLLATGSRELIEDSWRDDFWGWGPNRDGQNMLGKLWTEIRSELNPAIRALKSPDTESEVMPNQPATTGNNKTPPHPHPSANADADGAKQPPTAKQIWKQREPPEEMVWAVCPYLRSHMDDTECKNCPQWEEHELHGKCQRGCYGLAAEACRIVFAMQTIPQSPDGWVMVPGGE